MTRARPTALVLTLALSLSALCCVGDESPEGKPDQAAEDRTGKRIPRELLLAIPYVEGTRDTSSLSGVIDHDDDLSWDGINFFHSTNASRAWLLDMNGKGLWSWSSDRSGWDLSQLNRDGSLYALFFNEGIAKIDRDSNELWFVKGLFHHALELDEIGRIYTIDKRQELHPEIHDAPIPVDYVVVLDAEGNELERFSLLDVLVDSGMEELLPSYESLTDEDERDAELDFLHTNHVEPVPAGVGSSAIFEPGNLIVSFRNIDLVAILDGDTKRIIWSWGPGQLYLQHQPTLLQNGHLLIFDNGRNASEVIEIDPVTNQIAWTYQAEDFWSKSRGSVQRVPNGNTLITESNTGYAFEVTPRGQRVWTFANPETTETSSGDLLRRAIYRMKRYPSDYAEWISDPGSSN